MTFSFNLSSDKVDDCSICEFVLGLVKDIVGENFTKVSLLLSSFIHCCLFDVHIICIVIIRVLW